jgi:2-polyprenyl-6-methoxyphenol hydroxylase-like FAD-dependent oxidoreductase
VDARSWTVAAYVADHFAKGRVFLIGDAAHLMPPTGGFGGNTGIHDAHNLAWKLDAVLRDAAGPSLLDTYDNERRWIAERTLAQALARLQAWFKDPSKKLPRAEKIIDDYHVISDNSIARVHSSPKRKLKQTRGLRIHANHQAAPAHVPRT